MGMAYPTGAIVVPFGTSKPHSSPSRRTDLGCRWVADGHLGRLAKGLQGTISLQISGGPQRVRTADLRRANAATIVLIDTSACR